MSSDAYFELISTPWGIPERRDGDNCVIAG
jgi:hypothetical protein